MSKSSSLRCLLFLTFLLAPLTLTYAANTNHFLMGYWGNWHVWDVDKNGRSNDEYQIPGSLNKETRATVVNPVFQSQIQNLSAVSYAFFDAYPDAGMHKGVPQKPIDKNHLGKVFWSDPWTDLFNNPATIKFCEKNYIPCYFAYEIEKDPSQPRPPVDTTQPWNYFSMGNFDAFTKLPNVKHFISIGGWYHEDSFEKGAFENPDNFVNSIINIINRAKEQGGTIDGIDLDYEPPNGYTTENGTKLVNLAKQLRNGLDRNNYQHIMITAAMYANEERLNNFGKDNLKEFGSTLNYIGVMGYDFHGAWDNPPLTGLQSNLYNDPKNPNPNDFSGAKAVNFLISAGVPKSKIVLGIPSYGRVLGGISSTVNDGLYQPFNPALTPVEDLDKGQVSYYKIVKKWLNQGFKSHSVSYLGKTNGSWAYNPSNQQFASYDTIDLAKSKAEYVQENGLGGMMMWELISDISPDDASNASLLKTMRENLNKK